MKNFIAGLSIVACFGLLVIACGPDSPPPAQAVESFTAADPFQIACNAGYTRKAPHFCAFATAPSTLTLASASNPTGTCETIAAPASNATMVLLNAHIRVTAQNAIGTEVATMGSYTSNACSGQFVFFQSRAFENVAMTASTILDLADIEMLAPVTTGNFFLRGDCNAVINNACGGTGAYQYQVIGYYD